MSGVHQSSSDHLYAIGRQVQRRSRSGFALAFVKIGRSKQPDERIVSLASQFRVQDLWFDHVILVAVLRWGLDTLVRWALKQDGVPREMALFLDYAALDIDDPSPLQRIMENR